MYGIFRDLLGGNVGYARELVEAATNRINEGESTEDKRVKGQFQLSRSDLMRRIKKRV